MVWIGLDLGTSSVACTWYHQGRIRELISKGTAFPTSAAVHEGRILVGKAARKARQQERTRYVDNLKRRVRKRETLGVETTRFLAEIARVVARTVRQETGQAMAGAAVGIPNQFGLLDRRSYRNAFLEAGIDTVRLISEPAAAVVGFQYSRPQPLEGRFLVLDYGAGTTDISLGVWRDNHFQLEFCHGDVGMGGKDLDLAVLQLIQDAYARTSGEPFPIDLHLARLRGDPLYHQLRELAETVKCRLSQEESVILEESCGLPQLCGLSIRREEFERRVADEFARVRNLAAWVLEQAGLGPAEIDHVLFVGGSCAIPRVAREIASIFGDHRPNLIVEPERMLRYVPEGLGVLAAEPGRYKLTDVFARDIGLLAPAQGEGQLVPLMRMGDPKPADDYVSRRIVINQEVDLSPHDSRRIRLALMERVPLDDGGYQLEPVEPIYTIDLEETLGINKDYYQDQIEGELVYLPQGDEIEFGFEVSHRRIEATSAESLLPVEQYIEASAREEKLRELEQMAMELGPERGAVLHDTMEKLREDAIEVEDYLALCDIADLLHARSGVEGLRRGGGERAAAHEAAWEETILRPLERRPRQERGDDGAGS